MEKVTGGPPESPTRRAARIARVGARYGFGFVFGGRLSRRRGPADTGRIGPRLRLSLEEAPARSGPLTQAHRATLPGGRPALVVVDRPGIRRDLLAMRPVADLTRRRLGDRLPLDPSAIVAEFTAHVTHRRDMYSSAQISRRLRELEDFRLLVPDVY